MEVAVRPLHERDLAEADRIFRLAFGTFLGLPDPTAFAGDSDHVRSRWTADPEATFGAEAGGELVGSNLVTCWGSVGFFGPLSVRPDLWDRGVARRLLEPTVALLDGRGVTHAGLFTFAQSAKHVGLYQRFGFWPRFLTAVMAKPVASGDGAGVRRLSDLPPAERESCLRECRELTGAVHEGLDVEREIRAVERQALGETVLLREGSRLDAVAVCHSGKSSEAGSGTTFVEFGVVRPGPRAADTFDVLLAACDALARALGTTSLVAGVNLGREAAYRRMLARGFRTVLQGVAMHRPNEPGYCRPEVFLIDDWR